MIDPAAYSFAIEFLEVEKSIEITVRIAGEPQRFRIDALKGPQGYETRGTSRRIDRGVLSLSAVDELRQRRRSPTAGP